MSLMKTICAVIISATYFVAMAHDMLYYHVYDAPDGDSGHDDQDLG